MNEKSCERNLRFQEHLNSNCFLFQIVKFWDGRVRSYLGTRYDAGKNVYDMDFSMKLKERATLLDSREYATWRQTGWFLFPGFLATRKFNFLIWVSWLRSNVAQRHRVAL